MPPFGKEICHHSNRIKLHKVQESAGSAVGDGSQTRLQSKRLQGKQKLMMNIYWTKIRLRAAANQAIYLVILSRFLMGSDQFGYIV